jgi:glycosyltransferase involved in cell wall biosynthesis
MAADLANVGVKVQVVGNKFNRAAGDPQFQERLREKLTLGKVDWVDGATHEDSQRHMQAALFGYCVRSVELDNTVELSTKLLEYCAQGTPPILRRTQQHVELFGSDYPYFVDSPEELADLVRNHVRSEAAYVATVDRLALLARRYDIVEATARLSPVFPPSIESAPKGGVARRVPRMLVATHDSKFLTAVLDRISAAGVADVSFDRWASTHSRGHGDSVEELPHADVVWCEWCCEQAVWWSRNKRPEQTLIVRLHRFEAFTPFPALVDWSSVDHLIVVSDHFRQLAIEEFGVPERVIHVLPQYVDTAEFDRPKLRSADFTIGLVGINAFSHKRPDRAIEYITALAKAEPRFRLRIRSRMPWEFDWVWGGRPAERAEYIQLFQRCLQTDLRERVIFDRAGNDMPEWFRSVTAVLSSSDSEGCHTSVAEGMSSGCLAVCWAWPGATSVYGSRFVHGSIDAMVGATLSAVEEMHSPAGRSAMKADAAKFDIRRTLSLVEELLS